MKVILREELKGRGGEGDVIEVSRGFANNYLLPQGIAILANKGNLKQLEQRRHNIAKREEVRVANAEELKEKLETGTITIPARVGEEGQLFGSITSQMIAEAIMADREIEIDRRRIDIRQAIKVVGEHTADVSLYRDIKATLQLKIVDEAAPEGEEAPAEPQEAEVVAEEASEVVEEASEQAAEQAVEAIEAEAEEAAEPVEQATEEE